MKRSPTFNRFIDRLNLPLEEMPYKSFFQIQQGLLESKRISRPEAVKFVSEEEPAFEKEEVRTLIQQVSMEDKAGYIQEFFGLSLNPTPHEIRNNKTQCYGWCVIDALMIPMAHQMKAAIHSKDLINETAVKILVDGDELQATSHDNIFISTVPGLSSFNNDRPKESICSQVHFLTAEQSVQTWQANHPWGEVISLHDLYNGE